MAFINDDRFANGVPRLSGGGNNIRQWEYHLGSYAAAISGDEILKGSKPDDGSEEWSRIDDALRNTIIFTISAWTLEFKAAKAAKTAAEAFSAIKERFRFHVAQARIKVYSAFHTLNAASFRSAENFTTAFMSQLAAMEKEGFSTVPLEMVLRFLIALDPVLPVYCRHRRADIYNDFPVSLDTMISDLLQNTDIDKAFKDSYTVFERARKAKAAADSASGMAKNIAKAGSVCKDCGSSHKSAGDVCYSAHPELAPKKWVSKNMGRIVAAREYKEGQQQSSGFTGSSSSVHAEGGLEGGFTGFSPLLHALMSAETTSTTEAPIIPESTADTDTLMDQDHTSDAESESGGGCALGGFEQ
ncbi:hypothetical protein HBI80_054480 [Parastagonospora nodorum]|nr:hypothetical protein HBI80_054480 [Parastagonospora nodorum]